MTHTRFFPAVVLAAVLLSAPAVHSAEVAGIRIDETAKSGGAELILNGAGVRTKIVFKVYVAALYATKKTSNATSLIDSREPRRVVMHMLRDLDADSLVSALQEGLRNNLSETDLAKLKPEIDQFERLMRGIGNAKTGDVIGIDFSADGIAVAFNGQTKGSVAGDDFARGLLKVWLGDKPVDGGLKKAMLGS
jgi:long-chain acyl-CoA synthetase